MLQYKLPKKFDEKLKKRFANICKFFNHINKFILLLRKGIPKITHMNTWTVGKNSLPQKKGFYSYLNIEDITNANFKHAKRVRKDFEIKHLGEYHGLHVQSNTLLLAD